jgi:hypothetical protein
MAGAAASVLTQLLALLALAASSLVFGRAVLSRMHFDREAERGVFSLAVGMGLIGEALFLLGLARALYVPLILALLVLAHAACWRIWRELWRGRHSIRSTALLVAAAVAIPSLVLSLYPPSSFDETMYHLPYAKIFAREHAVVFAETLRFPIFPQLAHMIFTALYMVAGAESTHVVQLLAAIVIGFGLAEWSGAFEGPRAGLWAAALWVGNPIVVWFAATSYVDLVLAMFVLLALRALQVWNEAGERAHLLLAGALVGFSAGTKYHGLFVFALCLPVVAMSPRRSLRSLALFAFAGTLTLAPFYLRNLAVTGNPVFPFFGSVFGGSSWTPRRPPRLPSERLRNLIELPWDMVADSARRQRQPPYSPAAALLLPFAILWGLRNHAMRWLLAAMLIYAAVLSSADVRFLLPVIALLAVPSATILARAGRAWGASGPAAARLAGSAVVTIAIAAALASPGLTYGAFKIWERGPVPVSGGAREAYLTRANPFYPFLAELNRRHGRDYAVYTVFGEELAFYADGNAFGDRMGPGSYRRFFEAAGRADTLARFLRSLGVDYLLFDRSEFNLPEGPEFNLVMQSGSIRLYRVAQ